VCFREETKIWVLLYLSNSLERVATCYSELLSITTHDFDVPGTPGSGPSKLILLMYLIVFKLSKPLETSMN